LWSDTPTKDLCLFKLYYINFHVFSWLICLFFVLIYGVLCKITYFIILWKSVNPYVRNFIFQEPSPTEIVWGKETTWIYPEMKKAIAGYTTSSNCVSFRRGGHLDLKWRRSCFLYSTWLSSYRCMLFLLSCSREREWSSNPWTLLYVLI
jgi:hypothetical protein